MLCIFKFPNKNRIISIRRLNRLLGLQLEPINLLISEGPQLNSNLWDGFTLRCFQSLSVPHIATLRCPWQEQQIDQRCVQLGPLVAQFPSHEECRLYLHPNILCFRVLAYYKHKLSFSKKRFTIMQVLRPKPESRYGVKPKISNSSFFVFFLLVA